MTSPSRNVFLTPFLTTFLSLGLLACGGPELGSEEQPETPVSEGEVDSSVASLEQGFTAVADARVESTSPSANFGSESTVRVDGNTEGASTVTSYLRFNVSGVSGTVERAVLRLYVTSGTANGPRLFPTSHEWTESGITWANAPVQTGDFVADADALTSGTWTELDVSRYVKGNGTYSFLLRTALTDGSTYASRESGANAPRLVLTTLVVPPSTGTVFYVSRSGNNADGRSEATAWNELNKVQWSSLRPGDTLVIKGGTYRTRLAVGTSGALGKPLTLRAEGKVIIDGGRNAPLPTCGSSSYSTPSSARAPAIDLYGRRYVVIDGGTWSGIVVKNWYIPYGDGSNAAVDLRNAADVTLRNLEVADNGGVWWQDGKPTPSGHAFNVTDSQRVTVERLIAHDNGNDTFRANGSLTAFRLRESWVYNVNDDRECAHPDALQMRDHGQAYDISFEDSVFGPYLHHVMIIGDQSRVEKIRLKNVLAHHLFSSVAALRQSVTRAVTIDRLTSHLEWRSPPNLELSGGPTSSTEPRHVITNTLTKYGGSNNTPAIPSKVSCANSYQDYNIGGTDVVCARRTLRFADEDASLRGGDLRYANFRPLNTDINGAGSTLYSAQDLLAR